MARKAAGVAMRKSIQLLNYDIYTNIVSSTMEENSICLKITLIRNWNQIIVTIA